MELLRTATWPLWTETRQLLSIFFKTYSMAFFFSSSLQTTFLGNSFTLLCLKEHQKVQDLAELSLHRVPLKGSSPGNFLADAPFGRGILFSTLNKITCLF
eukprot:TRINITY_DN14113_c3_g1_i1.p1 TRINITY_DN14113_c3_g1~~TRINITY_DN14113_c3_g1_i1.p1  ORF type:complete len:100 (-),score=3.54 TRINITY_DN14113_c3_g1_i1:26-325(-)